MKYVTLDSVMRWKPCLEKSEVRELFAGQKRVNAENIASMPICTEHKVWALSHMLTEAEALKIIRAHKRSFPFFHPKDEWEWEYDRELLYWRSSAMDSKAALRYAVEALSKKR